MQTIKAGVMEIADLFVINKADQPGAAKLLNELSRALDMADSFPSGWRPPILTVDNLAQSEPFLAKVDEVRIKIDEHLALLHTSDILTQRERRKAQVQLGHALHSALLAPVVQALRDSGQWEQMLDVLVAKDNDPYTLAERIASAVLTRQWPQEMTEISQST